MPKKKPTSGSKEAMNGNLSTVEFLKYMDEFKGSQNTKFTELKGDITKVDKSVGIVIGELEHHADHIDDLEDKFGKWNFINSIGVVAGTIIGALFGIKE